MIIGKYILESLTAGMYKDPLIVYREYIQNSTDSIDKAIKNKILDPDNARVDIILTGGDVEIVDNGYGIPVDEAYSRLMDIGNSQKEIGDNQGFRGIGRLGGMSYCKKLEFTTSAKGENKKSIFTFDCAKLAALLKPGKVRDYDIVQVFKEIVGTSTEAESEDAHYFRVKMYGISDKNPELTAIDEIKLYISQVAPVSFNAQHFMFYPQIKDYFKKHNYPLREYKIFLGEDHKNCTQIFKPYKATFKAGRGDNDERVEIQSIKFLKNDTLKYILWYTENPLYGTIKEEAIKCIRLRKGNILIGDQSSLDPMFSKSNVRFNGWVQGELHAFDVALLPNARRDDFEKNEYYSAFITDIKPHGDLLEKKCREDSACRSENKKIEAAEVYGKKIETKLKVGFSTKAEKEKVVGEIREMAEALKTTKFKLEKNAKKSGVLAKKLEETGKAVSENKEYLAKMLSGYSKDEKRIIHQIFDIIYEQMETKEGNELIEHILGKLLEKK